MKKLLSIIALALAGSFASAIAAEANCLTVNKKSGEFEQFKLADAPTVKIVDHQFLITSPALESTYEFDEVSHFTFEEEKHTEAAEVISAEASFSFTYLDNATVIISAPELEWATVYSLSGVQVASAQAVGNVVTLDISSLSPGVYVVNPSCHNAVKIVKK